MKMLYLQFLVESAKLLSTKLQIGGKERSVSRTSCMRISDKVLKRQLSEHLEIHSRRRVTASGLDDKLCVGASCSFGQQQLAGVTKRGLRLTLTKLSGNRPRLPLRSPSIHPSSSM